MPAAAPSAPAALLRVAERDETLEEARARNVRDALLEDVGSGDWTGHLAPAGQRVRARVLAREAAVLCGRDWFDGVVHALDEGATLDWAVAEGGWTAPGQTVVTLHGNARALLAAERPALNFIQLLSATATLTRRHVDTVAGASPISRHSAS
jgi:nicotinate-nucleotide pyrophosphorylase (carboxylating)